MRSGKVFLLSIFWSAGGYCQDIPGKVPEIPLGVAKIVGEGQSGNWTWWRQYYGLREFAEANAGPVLAKKVNTLRKKDHLTFFSSISFPSRSAELVFVGDDGSFEGSWCSGRVPVSSLVTPQSDEVGEIRSAWRIPFYDLEGNRLSDESSGSVVNLFRGTRYFSDDREYPVLDFIADRYEFSKIVAILQIDESTLSWSSEGFQCFNAESLIGSHSSGDLRSKNAVIGDGEMFLWHAAPVRVSWDIRANGELVSVPFRPDVGAGFKRGGTDVRVVAVEQGIFSGGGDVVSETGRHKIEFSRESNVGWTCFLGSNLPGENVQRVEYLGSDGKWRATSAASQDFGIISLDLPSAESPEKLPEIRVVWKPKTLRVIADIQAIGGALAENGKVSTYNDIAFQLFGRPLDSRGISWRLYHFLGYDLKNTTNIEISESEDKCLTEKGKHYFLEDLIRIWGELNPGFELLVDSENRTIEIGKTE